MVEVQVRKHHVGHVLGADTQCGQLDQELPTLHRPALHVPQAGVDQHHPVTVAHEEPTERDLEHPVLGDESLMGRPVLFVRPLGPRHGAHPPIGGGRLHAHDAVEDRFYRDVPHLHSRTLPTDR